jgi:hypothetical protein
MAVCPKPKTPAEAWGLQQACQWKKLSLPFFLVVILDVAAAHGFAPAVAGGLVLFEVFTFAKARGVDGASREQLSSLEFLRLFGSMRHPSGCRVAEAPPVFVRFECKVTK